MNDFINIVKDMRYWQKQFFKTRNYLDMEQAKVFEAEVDKKLKEFSNAESKESGQENLF